MDGWLTIYSALLSVLATAVTLAKKNGVPRAAVDAERGVAVLAYPKGMARLAAIGAVVTVVGFAMACAEWPSPPEHPGLVLVLFGVLAAAAVPWAVALHSRIEVGPAGVESISAWGSRATMAWPDVREVTFHMGAFVLRAERNRKMRINCNRNGIKTLIAAMDAALPRKVYIGSVGDYNTMKRNMPAGM